MPRKPRRLGDAILPQTVNAAGFTRMLARLTRPGEPIEGAPLAVGHGENEDVVVMRLEGHDVRKLVGSGPTNRR